MREKFNEAGQLTTLYCEDNEFIIKPLWYHEKGLMQSATGYGRKLVTDKMIRFNRKLYRVYVSQFSNAGTAYILVKGNWIFIN